MASTEAAPPRLGFRRLVAGRGEYTGDLTLPHMAHVIFLRSPHAHARILRIDTKKGATTSGVILVATARELSAVCGPMHTVIENAPEHISPPQSPLAHDVARWQGEPVVAIVAETVFQAEDALEHVEIDWEPLPAVVDPVSAFEQSAALVHTSLGHNRAFDRTMGKASVEVELATGEAMVEDNFWFNRHTGVTLEPRAILADYDPIQNYLTVYQSSQVPHQMKDVFSRLLGIPEHHTRVICKDVGGGFGVKLHVYPDELATAALAKLLGRPIRFEARRSEAFLSDSHAREFVATARLAANADGTIVALDADLLCGAGAYSIYPRGSIGDSILAGMSLGAPYRVGAMCVRARVVYLNKAPTGSYRGVGLPIACVITETLIDKAAHRMGLDPVEFRRRSYHRAEDLPTKTSMGFKIESASLTASLDALTEQMDYGALRARQKDLLASGRLLGIGVASFIEPTAPSALLYGPAGINISSQDTATVRVDASGMVHCSVGCMEIGQGTLTGIAKIVADAIGVPFDHVVVQAGDTNGPHGGGVWASRGLSISGEAAHKAAQALRERLLRLAAALLQTTAESLDLCDSIVVTRADGSARMDLAELTKIAHFRQHLIPGGVAPSLIAEASFIPASYFVANGIQGCFLEIDRDTGVITLLKHWAVDDCGTVINSALVDGQVRGGIAQGIGAALTEHCFYDGEGQLLTGSLMDYGMPRADTVPDIEVGHLSTPQPGTAIGVKGAGEAGTIGASAAIWCAVNDALRPLGAQVNRMPFTPERILAAIDGRKVQAAKLY